MHQEYTVPAQDFSVAGVASSNFKRLLKQLNLPPKVIKRIIVAVFEAEVNVIAHSYGGRIVCELGEDTITVEVIDTGPGGLPPPKRFWNWDMGLAWDCRISRRAVTGSPSRQKQESIPI